MSTRSILLTTGGITVGNSGCKQCVIVIVNTHVMVIVIVGVNKTFGHLNEAYSVI